MEAHGLRYFKNTDMALYVLLIASLPFFSIRPSGVTLSFPLILLLVIAAYSLISLILKIKYYSNNMAFDSLLLVFILIATIYYVSGGTVDNFALVKSLTYFFVYILLKQLMIGIGYQSLINATTKGIFIGTSLYFILILYATSISGGISSIVNDLSYYGFTLKIYQAISANVLSMDELQSADIMRNSIGEVFSFYFIFIFINNESRNKVIRYNKIIFLWVNLILVLLTFSRRAFFSIATTFFISTSSSKKIFHKSLNIIAFVSVLYVFAFVFSGESRVTNFERDNRLSQYSHVLGEISNKVFLGHGYGAKVTHENKKKYVHNFVLASWYMMGIAGLLIGLTIFLYTVKQYITPIFKNKKNNYSYLLIIPILGMSIGGTVEGMFTLTSWIIYAFYSVIKYFQEQQLKTKDF